MSGRPPVSSLARRLSERIAREGRLSFRDFMEAALYDPEEGYYARGASIGEGGDFVTSPSISPLFARAIARLFAADAAALAAGNAGASDAKIVYCEAGAGSGTLLRDFRRELGEIAPDVARRTRLAAVERSASGRGALASVADVVAADPAGIDAPFAGWVFSNELYDALPVHRVVRSEGRLFELGVVDDGGRFVWTAWPAPAALGEYLARFGIALAEEQVAEINLEAGPLHRALARLLTRGRIVTFDYGHRAPVLYHSGARPRGTLAVHARGRRGGDPLERPGEVDLTAHVNWDDLAAAGEAEGFAATVRMRQAEFLMRTGLFEDAGGDRRDGGPRDGRLEAYRLIDPEGIGDQLSVLVQSKGMNDLPFPSR